MNTNKPTILIAGATGAIGQVLCKQLVHNYKVIAISRFPNKGQNILGNDVSIVSWENTSTLTDEVSNAFAVINLAGSSINCRWNKKNKSQILNSRINAGKKLVDIINKSTYKPKVFIQASAIGYYTSDYENSYNEKLICNNSSFLNHVCKKWESSTIELKDKNIRHITIRIGLVLNAKAGVLPSLLLPLKLFVGGFLGNGKQWFSWIHIDDIVKSIEFLLTHKNCQGIYNLTSPNPVRQKEFLKTLGQTVRRPIWLKIPEWPLKLVLGQMANETILSSLKVEPKKLLEAQYPFVYTDLNKTLRNILLNKKHH